MLYKLKEIREKMGISQTELANKAKVTRATISKIENGEEVEVKIGTLENLAKALECSVVDFSGNDNSSTATVDRIKDSAGTSAGNIADAARGNNNAEKAIQRADAELERSQAAAKGSIERINRIEQLVKECIDGNRKALGIMQRIEETNATGKEKSQP